MCHHVYELCCSSYELFSQRKSTRTRLTRETRARGTWKRSKRNLPLLTFACAFDHLLSLAASCCNAAMKSECYTCKRHNHMNICGDTSGFFSPLRLLLNWRFNEARQAAWVDGFLSVSQALANEEAMTTLNDLSSYRTRNFLIVSLRI